MTVRKNNALHCLCMGLLHQWPSVQSNKPPIQSNNQWVLLFSGIWTAYLIENDWGLCVSVCVCVGPRHLIQIKYKWKRTVVWETMALKFIFNILLIYYLFVPSFFQKRFKAALSIFITCRLFSSVCEYFVDWVLNAQLLKIILTKEGRKEPNVF